MTRPRLIHPTTGQPLASRRAGSTMPTGGGFGPADVAGPALASWWPRIQSEDGGYLRRRDETVARIRDLAAENGYLSGAVQRAVDEAIGANFMMVWRPDRETLGLPVEWINEWVPVIERRWRNYCADPRYPLDAAGKLNLSGLLGQAFRDRMGQFGETLALVHWLPRPGISSALAIQMVSPDRLSNPNGAADTTALRGGVSLDEYGRPLSYHIRSGHPTDPWAAAAASNWEEVPARTGWGRARVLHFFEPTGADQTRGKGLVAPALEKLKLGDIYERTELEAALINAIFAAFIETPFDKTLMDDFSDDADAAKNYQGARADFANMAPAFLRGAKIARLFPGEHLNLTQAGRANAAFSTFMGNVLRHSAAAMGQSYEQFANDWSKTNYSSARAAMLQAWKFLSARRTAFAGGVASPIFGLWLEEQLDSGPIPLPPGTPGFWEEPAAWVRAIWIGPGRGWVDPVKEAQAAAFRMEAGLSTLQDEAAEQGRDWLEILDQRERESHEMERRGLSLPATTYEDLPAGPEDEDPDARPGDPVPESAPSDLAARVSRMESIMARAAARRVRSGARAA